MASTLLIFFYISILGMKVKSISFLQSPSTELLPSDMKHMNYLQQKAAHLYENLKGVDNQTAYSIPNKDKTKFATYFTETRLCLNQEKFYYFCFDCSQSSCAGLCKKCFEAGNHHGHNWILKQFPGKSYCDCGFADRFKPLSVCSSHSKPGQSEKKLSMENENLYFSFLAIYTKIVICRMGQTYQGNQTIVEAYSNFVEDLCNSNIDYIKITYQVYSSAFKPVEMQTVLEKLVKAIDKNCRYENKLSRLFAVLCNYEPFEYMIAKTLVKLSNSSNSHGQSYDIKKCSMRYFYEFCKSPHILNKLASENIVMFRTNQRLMLDHYCEVAQLYSLKNRRGLLLPVWRYLKQSTTVFQSAVFRLRSVNKQTEPIKQTFFFIILHDCVDDISFTKEILALLVQNWSSTYSGSYDSNAQFFNQLVLVSLAAVQGRVSEFPNLFSCCDETKLRKFLATYLEDLFQYRKKCKFNSLTAKCFLPLLKKLKLPYSPTGQNSPLRIGRILSVVLRNLTAYEYLESFQIMKVAAMTNNKQLAGQKESHVVEWMKQYFYMRREVSAKLVGEFRKQQLTKIPEIQKFIANQTRYKRGALFFEYIGPQIQVSPELLLHSLSKGDEIYGIQVNNSLFRQDRSQLLNTLMTSRVSIVNYDEFHSYTKKDRYMICLTAALLNCITLGQNEVFVNYVHKLKQLSQNMKKPNPSVDRLFKIRQYAISKLEQNEKLQPTQPKMMEIPSEQIMEQSKVELINTEQIMKNMQNSQKHPSKFVEEQTKTNSVQSKLKESRDKKKSVFAEKLAARSKKFLMESSQQVQHGQKCLVCKYAANDYGLLYYYAGLRPKKSVVYNKVHTNNSKKGQQLRLRSCFHAVHEHCCPDKKARKCMLCGAPFDLFIPVMNSLMDEADQGILVRFWWDEEFKNFMAKNYKKMDDLEMFMILFHSLTADLDSAFLVSPKNFSSSTVKIQSYFQFIHHMFRIQDELTQKSIKDAITKQIKHCQNEEIFMGKTNALCSVILLNKLEGKNEVDEKLNQFVKEQLEGIKQKKQFKYFRGWLTNIEWLTKRKFPQFQKYFQNSTDLIELWKELGLISEIPRNMQDLRKLYQSCTKNCSALSCYFCITCDRVYCANCTPISKHIEQCICIFLDDGCLYYSDWRVNNQKLKCPIYFNFLMESYSAQNFEALEYLLDKELLNEKLQKIVI